MDLIGRRSAWSVGDAVAGELLVVVWMYCDKEDPAESLNEERGD